MNNFDFFNPTRILFGTDRFADLDKVVPKDARVLMVYGGGSIFKNGVHEKVKAALGDRVVVEYGGVEPNPSHEDALGAMEQVRAEQLNFVLAVGGGSVIDASKYIAAGALFEGDPWEIITSRAKKLKSALPIGVVLTLPATGSESNMHSVVTHKATHTKAAFSHPKVFPAFALMDPQVTLTLPMRQLGNGIVDAFVHITEQYLTYPADAPVQDRFAEGLLLTLIELGPKAVAHPHDVSLRGNLMWAATMALNGLIGVGVPQDWSTHGIGHELTALYNLDHAQTLAIVLPNLLQAMREPKHAKLVQYGRRVWGITEADESKVIDQAIARTRAFFESVGVKTRLSDYGLSDKDIAPVVAQLKAHGAVELGEHKSVTPDLAQRVLEQSL